MKIIINSNSYNANFKNSTKQDSFINSGLNCNSKFFSNSYDTFKSKDSNSFISFKSLPEQKQLE